MHYDNVQSNVIPEIKCGGAVISEETSLLLRTMY